MSGAPAQWQWWISGDAENYEGPFATREEAIAEARGHAMGEFIDERGVTMLHFYISEARQDPLVLADWIDVEDMINDAEETLANSDRVGAECDEGPWFDYPGAAFADLEARIRQACTDWQTAHGLVFTCRTFSASRNEETILIPGREDERAPYPAAPSSSGSSRGSTGPEGACDKATPEPVNSFSEAAPYEWVVLNDLAGGGHGKTFWGAAFAEALACWQARGCVDISGHLTEKGREALNAHRAKP